MLVNSKLTIYHNDKNGRNPKWIKQGPFKIWWYGGEGASYNKGLENANDVKIRIPKNVNDISNLEIAVGDILVKGIIKDEISMQSDLKSCETYNITSIIDNDTGLNKHIHIEGK